MLISPSKILFINCVNLGTLSDASTDKCIQEVSRSTQKRGTYPKLQVVKNEGFYFSLNDTQLKLYRYLEKIGKCGREDVVRVSLREVPEGIRKMMRVPDTIQARTDAVVNHADDDDDGDNTNDDSYCGDTDDDDSDWSDEEPSNKDIDESNNEDDQENESFI